MLREGKTQLGSVLMVLYHSYNLVQEEANETILYAVVKIMFISPRICELITLNI